MAFYNKGDQVRSKKRGIVGMIKGLDVVHGGIQYYEVFWGGDDGSDKISELDLEPYQPEDKPTESLIKGTLGGYQDFLRLITQQRLSRTIPLRNNIYAFNASRTRFFPYQFKPLIKFLDSPDHRLLICDEVGLGKTIEAGLILTELRARQTVRRVIVVCPANLSPKWRLELKKRLGEEFDILSAQKF
ncbi:MAG: helicase, partial [Deltaproteobacteria bacterium]|nr:helicase [Deltaproteobacteria bacterium]